MSMVRVISVQQLKANLWILEINVLSVAAPIVCNNKLFVSILKETLF